MVGESDLSKEQLASFRVYEGCASQDPVDPRVEALVTELINRVAGKWTMLILEVLIERGEVAVYTTQRNDSGN